MATLELSIDEDVAVSPVKRTRSPDRASVFA